MIRPTERRQDPLYRGWGLPGGRPRLASRCSCERPCPTWDRELSGIVCLLCGHPLAVKPGDGALSAVLSRQETV
jgi:hypothetical protein